VKDLFVFTADADALAVVRAVLARPQAIGIRPITYEVDRHTGRDPGMVKDGPELIRMRIRKNAFSKVVLIWDHEGSGWEAKSPKTARDQIRTRLVQVTWRDHSEAVVVVPEIEEWIWRHSASVARHLGIGTDKLLQWIERFCALHGTDCATCKAQSPKELLEFSLYQRYTRRPLPRDFERIAKAATLTDWQASQSFASFAETLRSWFPA
jgi:hypothetical protein